VRALAITAASCERAELCVQTNTTRGAVTVPTGTGPGSRRAPLGVVAAE
jgi:hypothetical protein